MRKKHWEVVIEGDRKNLIKALPSLNDSHLLPKQYQKMNTARAYQVNIKICSRVLAQLLFKISELIRETFDDGSSILKIATNHF